MGVELRLSRVPVLSNVPCIKEDSRHRDRSGVEGEQSHKVCIC